MNNSLKNFFQTVFLFSRSEVNYLNFENLKDFVHTLHILFWKIFQSLNEKIFDKKYSSPFSKSKIKEIKWRSKSKQRFSHHIGLFFKLNRKRKCVWSFKRNVVIYGKHGKWVAAVNWMKSTRIKNTKRRIRIIVEEIWF